MMKTVCYYLHSYDNTLEINVWNKLNDLIIEDKGVDTFIYFQKRIANKDMFENVILAELHATFCKD